MELDELLRYCIAPTTTSEDYNNIVVEDETLPDRVIAEMEIECDEQMQHRVDPTSDQEIEAVSHTTVCYIPDIIYTTLCKMQQIYYIHNGSNNVVHMQLISYIHNVGRWRHSTHQKCYC